MPLLCVDVGDLRTLARSEDDHTAFVEGNALGAYQAWRHTSEQRDVVCAPAKAGVDEDNHHRRIGSGQGSVDIGEAKALVSGNEVNDLVAGQNV